MGNVNNSVYMRVAHRRGVDWMLVGRTHFAAVWQWRAAYAAVNADDLERMSLITNPRICFCIQKGLVRP